jgi:hypothetical protein
MKAMDTDRFVNDLNRERSEACVFRNSEAERNPMRRLLAEKYDKYIERQKLRTTRQKLQASNALAQNRQS